MEASNQRLQSRFRGEEPETVPMVVEFVPCSFLEAMEALDKGSRIRITSLPESLYFRKVNPNCGSGEIWLCSRHLHEQHGPLDVLCKKGMAIMGSGHWEKERYAI